MRPNIALTAAVLALAALTAPAALADSLVYEKGGDVWVASPDGSGQRQVTFSGGWSNPSQSADGTLFAVRNGLIQRLDRGGRVLNQAGDPSGSGPLIASAAPGGAHVAYHYNNTGSITPGLRTALSHADRQTSNDEIFNIGGWINPSWIGDGTVLMFDGSETFTGDTLLYTLGGSGTTRWYEDPELSLSGGEIDASQTRFAATDGAVLRFYRLNAPPPAIAVESACQFNNPNGSFFRPTWSPDGARLAYADGDGIWVANVDLANCAATQASLVIDGGRAPDWGPAAPGRRLTASAPKRIALGKLLRGLKLRVNCQCRVTATLALGGKALGRTKKLVTRPTTLVVKPNRAGKARLRRGGTRVTVNVGGGGRVVSRRVKIVRPAASAAAGQPLLLDTWDYEMQSTRYRGPAGHFEGSWNFERPNRIRMHIPGYAASKPRPLRPRRGWLVATFRESRKCFSVPGGKVNVYRYRQVIRLKPTRVHDMEGEQVASAARLTQYSRTKPCIGRAIAGLFKGRAKREVGPERGTAEIGYNEGPSCDEALVEHFANEGDSFLDWDLPVISYSWTFSDGGTATGREPVHRYPGPGTHSATVVMRSVNGSVAKGTKAIVVSTPDPDCN